jgi:lipopolysaccharide export system protein LptA
MRQLNKLILPLLLLTSPICAARNTDTDQPIQIEADTVEIREQEGISTYQGGVIITRGSMVIKGELIVIHSNPQGVEKIVVEGAPASFRQLNELGEDVSAQSLEMTYVAETGMLVMKRQAVLVQKQNKFTSEHIIYNTRQDIVQAGDQQGTGGKERTPQRVTITIQPPKEQPPEDSRQNNNEQNP